MSTDDLFARTLPQVVPTTPENLEKYILLELSSTVEPGSQVTPIPNSTESPPPDGWIEYVHPKGYTYLHDPKRCITALSTDLATLFEEVLKHLRPDQAPIVACLELVIHNFNHGHDTPSYRYYFVDHGNREIIWLDHHSTSLAARLTACPVHTKKQLYWNHVNLFPTHIKLCSSFPKELDIDIYEFIMNQYNDTQSVEHEPQQTLTSDSDIAKVNVLIARLKLRPIRLGLDCRCGDGFLDPTASPVIHSRSLKLLLTLLKRMCLGTPDSLLKELDFLWVSNGNVSFQQVRQFKLFKGLTAEWNLIAAFATISLIMSSLVLSNLRWNAWPHPFKAPLMIGCTMTMISSLINLVATLVLAMKCSDSIQRAGFWILTTVMVSVHILSFLSRTVGVLSILCCFSSISLCLVIFCISYHWLPHASDPISEQRVLEKSMADGGPPTVLHLASDSFHRKPKSPSSLCKVADDPIVRELRECIDVTWKAWKSYNLGNSRFNLLLAIEMCQSRRLECRTSSGRKIEEYRLEAMQIVKLWQEATGRVFCADPPTFTF